jgi:hypothetical protein
MRSLLIGFGVYDQAQGKALTEEHDALRANPTLTDDERSQALARFENDFFFSHYDALKQELLDYLQQGVISEGDISKLMQSNHEELAWDCILVDEAQDWPPDERDVLYAIFPPAHFIIADGVDQFVRAQHHTDWTKGVDYHKPIVYEKRSLRQKTNLCLFVERYASALGVPWDVEPQSELTGGRIIISPRSYDAELHQRLLKDCLDNGNRPYEMLFLAPPSLVGQLPHPHQFKLRDEWARWGIPLWDGTVRDLRAQYPSSVSEHRLLQYDSCRGLEGWTVVCLELDDFVAHKIATAPINELRQTGAQLSLALRDDDEERRLYANRWSLIPLTRAMDTLVITLRNPRSETGQLLRNLALQMPDFVEWQE